MYKQSKLKIALRWITFIPLAFIISALALMGTRAGMGIAGIRPDWIIGRIVFEFVDNSTWGSTFLYAAVKIVPSHQKVVAYFLAIFCLIVALALIYYAISIEDYWIILSSISLIIGVAVILIGVISEEIEFNV
jgi:hypothetical protein